jgi:hypothetical protein
VITVSCHIRYYYNDICRCFLWVLTAAPPHPFRDHRKHPMRNFCTCSKVSSSSRRPMNRIASLSLSSLTAFLYLFWLPVTQCISIVVALAPLSYFSFRVHSQLAAASSFPYDARIVMWYLTVLTTTRCTSLFLSYASVQPPEDKKSLRHRTVFSIPLLQPSASHTLTSC